MNALLIHDLTAAIERDAEDLSTSEREPFTKSWPKRYTMSRDAADEYLESLLAGLRLGPPSMRR